MNSPFNKSPFQKVVANEIVGGIPGRQNPVPVDESAFVRPEPTTFPSCRTCGAVALKGQDECGKCKALRLHNEKIQAQDREQISELQMRVQNLESQVAVLSLLNSRLENLEKSLGIGETDRMLQAVVGAPAVNKAPSLD